jgi:hypothetical protein
VVSTSRQPVIVHINVFIHELQVLCSWEHKVDKTKQDKKNVKQSELLQQGIWKILESEYINGNSANACKYFCTNCNGTLSTFVLFLTQTTLLSRRYAVAQLVEALPYKPEDSGFDSRWCHWNFFHWHNPSGRGVDSASNGNEYQEYFLGGKSGRCVGLTTLSFSYTDCLEIW